MLRRHIAITLSATIVGLIAVTSVVLAQADNERADCPGKIVCPQTGEQVCRDKCPTIDPDRADCPGRITCPNTGELICRDKSPTVDAERPDCPGRIVCPQSGRPVCKDRCPISPTAKEKPSCCSNRA